MRVAYATMLYRTLPPAEAVVKLHNMGVDYYELSYDNFINRKGQEDALLEETQAALKRQGLTVSSVHLPYDKPTLDMLAQGKEGAVTRMIRWMRAARDMGATIAVIHTLPLKRSESAMAANISVLSRLVKEARELGLALAVENRLEGDLVGSNVDELIKMASSVDGLKLCIDVGHLNVNTRNPPDEISKASQANLIAEVHAHDNDGYADEHALPMTGTVDWYRVAGALLHFDGQITYEVSCGGPEAKCDNYVRFLKMFNRNVFS
ncbi:sugar phosphate isomerase/epimerase family protein [Acidilobus sp.]|jgi:sugar phosphate isomerase/epimerase|uniref:sugar phosphate isomerase/epimerase family protein n=1 Tax=Acidilobus sp. TaxID=1872109 RepID=UPI003CFE2E55